MTDYVVEQIDEVTISAGSSIEESDLMSPYVWREAEHYRLLVRVVGRISGGAVGPTGLIYHGISEDGLRFRLDDEPAIAPTPDSADAGGCEDPTVLVGKAGYTVFYTGVDAAQRQGALLTARGADLRALVKEPLVLKAPPGEGNIKEATLAPSACGDWRLFYEYAANDASRVGLAIGPTSEGPWTVTDDPFGIRPASWDNWHLSTGPIVQLEGRDPTMFYNGATRDARWRIGWVCFDSAFSRVVSRGIEPLIVPPPTQNRADTDIAFAASSLVVDDRISLYFSLDDRVLRRARIRSYG